MPAIALDCLQTLLWLNRRHGQLLQENELIRRAHRRSGPCPRLLWIAFRLCSG